MKPSEQLKDFMAKYLEDDNEWWRIGSGHHQDYFDEVVDLYETADAENQVLRGLLEDLGVEVNVEVARGDKG
jgi:DNA-binding ferritin-like protein (Dps family)